MYKGVIFDFGNTLATSSSLVESLVQVYDDAAAAAIGACIEQKIRDLYRPEQSLQPAWQELWRQAFVEQGCQYQEAIARAHLQQFAANNINFDFAYGLLKALKSRGKKLVLLSNVTGPVDIFNNDLRQRGLAEFFDGIVWSSQIHCRKPAKAAFSAALAAIKLPIKDVLMVGDSELADVLGARRIGMDSARLCANVEGVQSKANYLVSLADAYETILSITG